MRPVYDALGTIAACALASGDDIVRVIRESDPIELGLTVDSGGQWINFVTQPHHESVTVIANYRLSAFDSYPIDEYVSEDEGTDAAETVVSNRELPQIDLRWLTFTPEERSQEFFDGVQVREHVYPYDDGFRLREYVEVRNDLRHYTLDVFNDIVSELGHTIEEDEENATRSDMEVEGAEGSPAFQ